jgi:methyl-accepting chemotaxis protein
MTTMSYLNFNSWNIATKITVFSLGIALTPLIIMGYLQSSEISSSAIEDKTGLLDAVVEERAARIESTFKFAKDLVIGMSGDDTIVEAMKDFEVAFGELASIDAYPMDEIESSLSSYYDQEFKPRLESEGEPYRGARSYLPASDSAKVAQMLYISSNPSAVGSKHEYDRAPQEVAYNEYHSKYHGLLSSYKDKLDAYDIFLVNNAGDIVYSVFKEADYATNLLKGPYASTNLADVFRSGKNARAGELVSSDFAFYEPSYGASAIFFASPMFDGGKQIGVICVQLPLQVLFDQILGNTIQETGTTHLIGSDKKIRSALPESEDQMLATSMETELGTDAFKSESGHVVGVDMSGFDSLGVYRKLHVADELEWSLVGEIHLEEVLAKAKGMQRGLYVETAISGLGIIGLAIFFARSLSGPIRRLVTHNDQLASGDFSMRLDSKRKDEIGQLASSMDEMAGQIGTMISEVVTTANEVASAATEIASSSEQMAAGLQSQEAETNDVSAAIEELSGSVAGISEKSVDATSAAENAGNEAGSGGEVVADTIKEIQGIAVQIKLAVEAVSQLGHKSEQIGEIISVINDIADQTNLLALNAAIEAARAGEHGRGFAVVADEVRKLAERTQQATEQVGSSIREIQDDTKQVIESIEQGATGVQNGVEMAQKAGTSLSQIVGASGTLNSMINDISHAVDEQKVVVNQIAEATQSIAGVTRESSSAAGQAAQAANNLSEQSERLLAMTSKFNV